uniref:NADH-ubiquinone oxidoreductase chain 4L n=1 Tax=Sesamia inferens TaxID=492764 RepID=F8V7F2_SESIF|nr:NADH dehydrogenase subunit 4L [Sesamia inferens]AEI29245.1 NADH dehydrogenase subunit 4L [Sesamia inferens]
MMILNIWVIFMVMFNIGNLDFYFKAQTFISLFYWSLEFIVLSIFFFFLIYLSFIEYDLYMLMVFLVFSVCEGALGLSILVSMIRTHGNDYFQSFNML